MQKDKKSQTGVDEAAAMASALKEYEVALKHLNEVATVYHNLVNDQGGVVATLIPDELKHEELESGHVVLFPYRLLDGWTPDGNLQDLVNGSMGQ